MKSQEVMLKKGLEPRVQSPESGVQSRESRLQTPVLILDYAY